MTERTILMSTLDEPVVFEEVPQPNGRTAYFYDGHRVLEATPDYIVVEILVTPEAH